MTYFGRDIDGTFLPPAVSGSSAMLNETMFFVCSSCGATVIDFHYSTVNRDRHEQWHGQLVDRLPTAEPDQEVEDAAASPEETFNHALAGVINRFSKENESDTPDFILADFLEDALVAWNKSVGTPYRSASFRLEIAAARTRALGARWNWFEQ